MPGSAQERRENLDKMNTSTPSSPKATMMAYKTKDSKMRKKEDATSEKLKKENRQRWSDQDKILWDDVQSEGRRQQSQLAGSDTRDAFTKKMEKLLGLNRSSAQIDKDVAATKELDKDLLYKGGKVKSRSKVSRGNTSASKKYTMNRGGKVASVRKPTRA